MIRNYSIFFLLLFHYSFTFSQNLVENYPLYYEKSPIYNFKSGVLSISFDDGVLTQFTIAEPILSKRKLPATFYVITKEFYKDINFQNYVRSALNNNHEIGSHTLYHPHLSKLNNEKIDFELGKSKEIIDFFVGNFNCLTLAYPYGDFSNNVINFSQKYYIAARSTVEGFNQLSTDNLFRLKARGFSQTDDIKKFEENIHYITENQLWMIEVFHGIESVGFKPIKAADFQQHMDFVKRMESKLWVATVSSVVKYIKQCQNTNLFCIECNDVFYKLGIEDSLNDSIFNLPLSLKIKIPNNWDEVVVQNADYVDSVSYNGNKFILLNVKPNSFFFTLKPRVLNPTSTNSFFNIISLKPSNSLNELKIYFDLNYPSIISFYVRNIAGQIIIHEQANFTSGINQHLLQTSSLSKGVYILEIMNKTYNQRIVKKFVKY